MKIKLLFFVRGKFLPSNMAMEKHLFNLKFAAKQLERDSKKCDKEEKVEKNKLKKAIEKGNMEVARIHAENGKPCLPIRIGFLASRINGKNNPKSS